MGYLWGVGAHEGRDGSAHFYWVLCLEGCAKNPLTVVVKVAPWGVDVVPWTLHPHGPQKGCAVQQARVLGAYAPKGAMVEFEGFHAAVRTQAQKGRQGP